MRIQGTALELRKAGAQIKLVKAVLKTVVDEARVLLDEDKLHEIKDEALTIGSDVATIEAYLNDFEKIGFGQRRFAVKK